jgi:hypothetical protein
MRLGEGGNNANEFDIPSGHIYQFNQRFPV